MDISIYLARVMGICFIVFGITLLLNRSIYKPLIEDFIEHPGLVLFAGSVNLVIGALIIVSHNIWEIDWRVLITLIGWILFIRGIIWLSIPVTMLKILVKFRKKVTPFYIASIISLILGIVLSYVGFSQ